MSNNVTMNGYQVELDITSVHQQKELRVCAMLAKSIRMAKQLFDQLLPPESTKRSIVTKAVPVIVITVASCFAADRLVDAMTPPCAEPCQGAQAYEYKRNRADSRLIVFMGSALLTEMVVTCFFLTLFTRVCCGYIKDKYQSKRIQEIKQTHLD